MLLFGNHYRRKKPYAQEGGHNIDHKRGAEGADCQQYTGGSGSRKLYKRLHRGIDAVKPHELILGDKLGKDRVDRWGLDTCTNGTDHRHNQQTAKQQGLFRDVRHCQHHNESNGGYRRVRTDDELLPIISVCPNAAQKRNKKLGQIGADAKCRHPCAGACVQRYIPHNRHLDKRGTKQRDTLADQEKDRSAFPVSLSFIFHLLNPPYIWEDAQIAGWDSHIQQAVLFQQNQVPAALYGSQYLLDHQRDR